MELPHGQGFAVDASAVCMQPPNGLKTLQWRACRHGMICASSMSDQTIRLYVIICLQMEHIPLWNLHLGLHIVACIMCLALHVQ